MIRLYLTHVAMPFWASPGNTIENILRLSAETWRGRAALHALTPGFPPEDVPQKEPPPRTVPPIPTDMPLPEPIDVPAPDPKDVPAPEPGKVPGPAKPRPDEQKPKPRSIP